MSHTCGRTRMPCQRQAFTSSRCKCCPQKVNAAKKMNQTVANTMSIWFQTYIGAVRLLCEHQLRERHEAAQAEMLEQRTQFANYVDHIVSTANSQSSQLLTQSDEIGLLKHKTYCSRNMQIPKKKKGNKKQSTSQSKNRRAEMEKLKNDMLVAKRAIKSLMWK